MERHDASGATADRAVAFDADSTTSDDDAEPVGGVGAGDLERVDLDLTAAGGEPQLVLVERWEGNASRRDKQTLQPFIW